MFVPLSYCELFTRPQSIKMNVMSPIEWLQVRDEKMWLRWRAIAGLGIYSACLRRVSRTI
jgi:hypothetical protein